MHTLKDKLTAPMRPVWVCPDADEVLEWHGEMAECFLEAVAATEGVLNDLTRSNRKYYESP